MFNKEEMFLFIINCPIRISYFEHPEFIFRFTMNANVFQFIINYSLLACDRIKQESQLFQTISKREIIF